MSQRPSGWDRKENDAYNTPRWTTEALLPHIPAHIARVWECAAGTGQMSAVLKERYEVLETDIGQGADFLADQSELLACVPTLERPQAIITNPPYNLATEFCEQALRLMEPVAGFVALLLRTDFDHAKSRAHLFRDCPAFAKKLVLTRRIVWFEPAPGEKGKSPSFNHAWYCWDWTHDGPPTICYGP